MLVAKDMGHFPNTTTRCSEDDPITYTLHKVDNRVIFEFLQTPNIAGNLDYLDIVYVLCQVLQQIYQKMLDPCLRKKHLYDAFILFDSKIEVSLLYLCAVAVLIPCS